MIIALLTDFGTTDYFVGAMKGAILSVNPHARIIDITHQIEPQDIAGAGFTLKNCYREFPPETIFVCVVDPGVGSPRRALVVEASRYRFVLPDNGLIGFVLDEEVDWRAYEIANEKYFRHPVSRTFHGRDIFAPVAAWLARGIKPEEFGSPVCDPARFEIPLPERLNPKTVSGRIINCDRFGNLITNLTPGDLVNPFVIEINGQAICAHRNHYAEAKADEIFTIFGSAGYLEIVAFRNSAQKLLRARRDDRIIAKM